MASERMCCMKRCVRGAMQTRDGRVEVRTFEVPEKDRDLEVSWDEEGQAVFHDTCWNTLLDSSKKGTPFSISPKEKKMLTEAYKTAEYFDPREKIMAEADRIQKLLKNANHPIAFTGAGISTSAGIGDFRGKSGKWTEREQNKVPGATGYKKTKTKSKAVKIDNLRPTYTHEALVKLMELGYLRFVISQNTDGLHRLSGVPREKLAELHGNSFHELCEKCHTRYERPFGMRKFTPKGPARKCPHCRFDHHTGRTCEHDSCDGSLIKTIINFGDMLESEILDSATEQAEQADMVLCLGSTLRVTPACDLVEMGDKPNRLAICNRQPTPFDDTCREEDEEGRHLGSRVFGDCDDLMREIMKRILPAEDLEDWEGARDSRMEEYDQKRVKS